MALAVGFSPSNLVYNLEPNEEECKTVTINSESETITVSDVWAENVDVEWKVSNFDTDTSEHGLSLTHSESETEGKRIYDVCLKGSQKGEYHGAIIFKQGQEGNSIIQMAVWLKVVISESEATSNNDNTGVGSNTIQNTPGNVAITTSSIQNDDELNIEELSENATQNQSAPGITGSAIDDGGPIEFWNFVPVVAIGAIILAIVLVNRKLKKARLGGNNSPTPSLS